MSIEIASRLEKARKELLDLGLRNSLINHRQRAKQVRVVDELSPEVFRLFVTEGKKMSFDALPDEAAKALAAREGNEDVRGTPSDISELLAQPDENAGHGPAARHTDLKLQTSFESEKLQKRLLSIHNDARTYIEEQGVNVLFLAVGFLHWFESDSASEARRAPLILVPVELERSSAQERFRIRYTEEDLGDNLSLFEKLKLEFAIELPMLGDSDSLDVNAFFSQTEREISGRKRWSVKRNEMTLGFFSFGKFLMYKDLSAEGWREGGGPGEHDILSKLLGDGFGEEASPFGEEDHIDEVIAPSDVNQVKDADSSQILAILDVNAGRNLVLQGPPGTGKSQTITNIIAECIGSGKRVLFVAEKMAALEVVKRRLDEIGLGDAVLELHSHKTNKKKILEELNRTLHQGRPRAEDGSDDIATLTRLRDRLNAYCDAVNKPIGKTRQTFIRALGHALNARPELPEVETFSFDWMADWTESDFREAHMRVEVLDRHLAEARAPDANPFRGSQLNELLPSQQAATESAIRAARATTKQLCESAEALASSMMLPPPTTRGEVAVICRAARRAMTAPHLRGVQLRSGDWQRRRDDVLQLLEAGRALEEAHAAVGEAVIDETWQADLVEVRQQYASKGNKWWRVFSGEFRNARTVMQGYCREPLPKQGDAVLDLVDTILDSQKHQRSFEELQPLGSSLFGSQWKNRGSDWDVLERILGWVVELYREVGDGTLPEGILRFLEGSPAIDRLGPEIQALETVLQEQGQLAQTVAQKLLLPLTDEDSMGWRLNLPQQVTLLTRWESDFDSLQHLVRFNQLATEFQRHGLGPVVATARSWKGAPGELVDLFDFSWWNGLVEKAYSETDSLRTFDRSEHLFTLEEFSRLDKLHFHHNRLRLISEHWKRLPTLSGGGALGIIGREMNKKRRHLPIRKLIEQAGRGVQAIKPIFMMSPMSVAKYLPPDSVEFDLVVFDEASQVKPVDAFGSIVRGRQTVVVGDSKQLPPTSFFDAANEGDEADYESVGDMESVLSLFLAQGIQERMLRWHYRSEHDSLIAVSNNEFYDNRLVVFPSPGANPRARGLRLRHFPNNYYDRGGTRSNVGEAKEVALAVMQHARELPDLSLGVVGFSVAQRDAIEVQVELLRRADPSCEDFFSEGRQEPFFVKNLENVQGDERDVIFISVGYGKNQDGYMAMSFGPLNRDGGERRLNVLISRSKKAMDVFSNFTSADVDLNRSKARGVVALRNFLAYAETGIIEQPYSTGREPDSPFEEAVIKALHSHGYELEPQVGTAGFFVDIGVKDPENPGRYLLGIECDGATYHSSRSARDRDRLRQEVLERLGWRLHRIWSTEWFRKPEVELERAIAAIEEAGRRQEEGAKTAASPRSHAPPEIEREAISKQDEASAEVGYDAYERAAPNVQLAGRDLHELSVGEMGGYVAEVVSVESPVHRDEVVKRITEGAGLQRAGSRIQAAVDSGISRAVRIGKVERRGEFLWQPGDPRPPIRNRSNLENSQKKFDLVAPEEIAAAIRSEVERSFSITEADAVSAAGRALGFQRVTAQASRVIQQELDRLIDEGALVIDKNLVRTA